MLNASPSIVGLHYVYILVIFWRSYVQAIKGESMRTRFEEVKEGLEASLRRIAILVSQDVAVQVCLCKAYILRVTNPGP